MNTILFFYVIHVTYGFVVDRKYMMLLQWFWVDCLGDIHGRDILCVLQCVFLKKMSDVKFRDVVWFGGVGEDDTTDNLGRGNVDFLHLVNIVDGYPYLYLFLGLGEIGGNVDEVIEGEEGIFFLSCFFGPCGTTVYHHRR